jgi:hypothetical protein
MSLHFHFKGKIVDYGFNLTLFYYKENKMKMTKTQMAAIRAEINELGEENYIQKEISSFPNISNDYQKRVYKIIREKAYFYEEEELIEAVKAEKELKKEVKLFNKRESADDEYGDLINYDQQSSNYYIITNYKDKVLNELKVLGKDKYSE